GGNTWSTSATSDVININAVGNYIIDVTHTDVNGCSSTSAPINVTVNALPVQPVITAFGSLVICNGTTVTLASNEPSGNVWSSSETTQSIAVSAAGSYTVTYTDLNGCSQISDAVQVTVNTPIPATLNLVNAIACEGDASIVLSGGLPVGGSYIGSGVINNVLYPTLLPGGVYNIDYVVNDINGCTSIASQNFTINSSPILSLSIPQTVFCLNDNIITMSASPIGGVYSGNGVVGNTFNPSLAGAGIHSISYQFTDGNSCTSIESIDVIVNALPQLTLLPISNLCENTGVYALNNGFPSGGTYEIDGIVATEINTDLLSTGTHILTYNHNPGNGCGNSISTQFVINATPLVSLPLIADICETALPITLTGGIPAGGNYTGSGVLGGVFYPNLANTVNTITYTYTDLNGCSSTASQNVTVIAPQAINFAPLSSICVNSSPILLNSATPVGGIYTGVGVASNIFDPQTAGVGVHTITYEVIDANACLSSSNQTIIVNALPVISTVSVSPLCSNSDVVPLTFAQPVGGIYSGVGVVNNIFDPLISGNGSFNIQYVYTDNNACSDTVYENVIVNAAPTVTHTNYSSVCENSGIITLNNGLPTGGIYSGNFVNANSFNSNLSGPGTFTITYTYIDANGCAASADANIVVNSNPIASLSPLGNICNGAGPINLSNGLPVGGTYYGLGVTGGILDPSILPNGTQTLGYTFTNADGCVDSTSLTYNTYTLQANAGSDQSITCTNSALLQGQSNYSGVGVLSYTWSPALGLSSTNTQNTIANPASTTNYILTVSDGLCSSDDTVLVVVAQPNFNLSVTPSAQILNAAPFIVFFTNNTPNPTNYSFTWDFGDGTSYNGFQPIYHNYTSNGSFTVTLIATALGSGCTDTLTMSNLITCNNGVFCNDSANIFVGGVLIPNNSNYSTTICASQNFVLGSNTGANYTHQWYFNGLPLQGATGVTYAPTVSGYYAVAVEDSSCINLSSPAYIIVLPTPNVPFITSSGSNNFCGGGTMILTANTGYSSYLWSTGSTQSSITISSSGNYWVQGYDANGCYAQSLDFAVNGSNMLPQYICVATVDTNLNENRIIWEKPITTSIDSFVVYRESNLAGVYNEIGRVDYNSNSEFVDTASNPSVNNNRYRLAILDSCGNLTTQGDIHATIKTWITQLGNGDSLEIFFTKYVGIDSLSYTLYRGPSATNLSPVGNAYTFNGNANYYSIKDLSPPAFSSGYVYYQIRANIIDICSSDSSTYQHSISNTISYGNALSIENMNQVFSVNAFPNPNNGTFNISIESGSTEDINLIIYNQIGEVVWTKYLDKLNGKTTLSVSMEQAAQGVYQLQVMSSKQIINKKLIINK
ncbi:MAG TPA: PKD domain-containing protein, partial [Bacteroidia bacterium]|nr:PKD domain-containing protein [Bacteroidia bacterium]